MKEKGFSFKGFKGFLGWGFVLIVASATVFSGCSWSFWNSFKDDVNDSEVYKTDDGGKTVWLQSPGVMRIKDGANPSVTARYSVESDGGIRVVMAVDGMNKEVYFKRTKDGLIDEGGTTFYSPKSFRQAREKRYCSSAHEMLEELAKVEGAFFTKTGKYVVDLNNSIPSGFAFTPARGLDVSVSGVPSEYVTAFASSEFCSVAYKWASNDYGTGVEKSFPVAMLGTKIIESRERARSRTITLLKKETAIKAMVLVKGGCFEMGSNGSVSDANEKPVHRVCLDDFRMDKYEVTQAQFRSVMGNNRSYHKNCPNCPVERVSFSQALAYCKALGTRLPTEAEWEYAAREMGKDVEYGTGRSEIDGNSATYHARGTTPVGRYAANSLGLYDMSGNVWEWTDDWRDDNYYGESPLKNPQGPDKGMYRIIRGGSWRNLAFGVRTTKRGWSRPNNRFSNIGFRCVVQ